MPPHDGVPIPGPGLRHPQQRVAATYYQAKYARQRRRGCRARHRPGLGVVCIHPAPADADGLNPLGLDLRGPTRLALSGFTYS